MIPNAQTNAPASLLEVSGAVEFGIRVTPAPAVCEWLQAEILANTGSIHNEDHGQTILGKDGKTPLTPLEGGITAGKRVSPLAKSLRNTSPRWGGGEAAFKRSEMTSEQKRDYQRKHVQTAYLQLPK